MNANKVWLVFRKDWREIRRNWQVLAPVIVVPLIISVVMPAVIMLIPNITPQTASSTQQLEELLKNMPTSLKMEIAGMTSQQAFSYILTVYLLAPLFLITPIMASSVISSDSFAGEKERKTIEALLATPLSDSELFLGKVLVSFIPAIIITFISFTIYGTVVDILGLSTFSGRLLLPNATWLIMVFGLAPLIALASIGLTVMISAKVKGFREAQQISVILLLPVLAMMFGQVSGVLFFGPLVTATMIGVFAVVDLLVLYAGIKVFKREEILSKPA